ncbi:MAG: CHAT domain-containing protein, partial [Cyclobacteriaceae bacterium]
ETFWQPVKKLIDDKKEIFYSPDGVLVRINPLSLYDPEVKKPLADQLSINTLVSSSIIAADNKTKQAEVSEATLVGNIRATAKLASEVLAETNELLLKNRIKTTLKEGITTADNKFTKGILYLDKPVKTRLPENSDTTTWTAYKIREMLLDSVSLVIFRAADENIVEDDSGEQLSALQKAFTISGADYQLVELWRTEPQISRLFFEVFYKELLRKNRPVKEAFSRARKAIRKKAQTPEQWSSFVLISGG